MKLIPTAIAGCHRVSLELLEDARGHFALVFDLPRLRATHPALEVVQVNRSLTRMRGAIRGLHFQSPPKAEFKLVQCLQGRVYDVCVDMRPESPTYLKWVAAELSPATQDLLLIPQGCAHGFQTLTEDCLVEYFVSELYSPRHQGGMRWDDPAIGIDWPLPCSLTSERDAAWPLLMR